MKTVNLEEIILKCSSKNLQEQGKGEEESDCVVKNSIEDGYYWYIIEAMKEACKQTLELAAENAVRDYPHDIKHEIKMNVINTINQIK